MAKRAHSSIGDVLNQLRDEFPDITISKIRFLESQGLIDPERTPSGYRKFYPADVERLRFILRQQTRALPAAEGDQGAARRDRQERRFRGRRARPTPDGAQERLLDPEDRRRAVRGDAPRRAGRRSALGRVARCDDDDGARRPRARPRAA